MMRTLSELREEKPEPKCIDCGQPSKDRLCNRCFVAVKL